MTSSNTICNDKTEGYKRDWSKNNSSLVKRIDFLMDMTFLDSLDEALERENEGKVGHPYEYPQEFFEFLAKIRSLWNIPFRELDGFVRKLSELTGKFKPLSYVAIFNGIRGIPIGEMLGEMNGESRDGMTVIIDSSDLKITERGDWLSSKWNERKRGWIKIHVAVDAGRMNVVSLTISDEHTADSKEFKKVLDPVIGKASAVYGDGGYDNRSNFDYLRKSGVGATIPTRKNSVPKARGSYARASVVRAIMDSGLDSWKKEVQYGKR